MGMTDKPHIDFDSDLVQLLIDLYEGMGNQIALQYAGSGRNFEKYGLRA